MIEKLQTSLTPGNACLPEQDPKNTTLNPGHVLLPSNPSCPHLCQHAYLPSSLNDSLILPSCLSSGRKIKHQLNLKPALQPSSYPHSPQSQPCGRNPAALISSHFISYSSPSSTPSFCRTQSPHSILSAKLSLSGPCDGDFQSRISKLQAPSVEQEPEVTNLEVGDTRGGRVKAGRLVGLAGWRDRWWLGSEGGRWGCYG